MDSWSAPFSPRDLRDAFGLFPTGVAVITANAENSERLGLTVSSFNSVSVEPPLVQFSIAKTAKSLPAWEAVSHFAVNILTENQSEISTRFAKALSDKWDGVHSISATMIDAHLIRDVLASMECKVWAR
jgi:flavin reductase (DIM6/NTAB) family NADH-FMN oxidoreductase RutF